MNGDLTEGQREALRELEEADEQENEPEPPKAMGEPESHVPAYESPMVTRQRKIEAKVRQMESER